MNVQGGRDSVQVLVYTTESSFIIVFLPVSVDSQLLFSRTWLLTVTRFPIVQVRAK